MLLGVDLHAQGNGRAPETDVLFSPFVLPELAGWGDQVLQRDELLMNLVREHRLGDRLNAFLNTRHQRTPRWTVTENLVGEIGRARRELRVAMYTLTSKEIADGILALHQGGRVKVRVIFDRNQATSKFNKSDKSQMLIDAGVSVRLLGDQQAEWDSPKMHHKFAVIDDATVVTGSFNWTVAADEKNFENLIFLRNDPLTTAKFLAEFDWMWEYAEALGARDGDRRDR